MDAVGDVGDWQVGFGPTGKRRTRHLAGDVFMDPAHSVGRSAEARSEECHVEWLIVVVCPGSSQCKKVIYRDAKMVRVIPDVLYDQCRLERVESGHNRCMRGEHRPTACRPYRLLK